jgi:hypothetical protein
VQEQDGGDADGQDGDGQGAQVERVLADLADDHEDEDCVDHIYVDVHVATVALYVGRGVGPRVGSRVDPDLNPWVDRSRRRGWLGIVDVMADHHASRNSASLTSD